MGTVGYDCSGSLKRNSVSPDSDRGEVPYVPETIGSMVVGYQRPPFTLLLF